MRDHGIRVRRAYVGPVFNECQRLLRTRAFVDIFCHKHSNVQYQNILFRIILKQNIYIRIILEQINMLYCVFPIIGRLLTSVTHTKHFLIYHIQSFDERLKTIMHKKKTKTE